MNTVKNNVIRARVETSLKNEVGRIFDKLGLTYSDAIYLFLKRVKLEKGLPFEVKIPNKQTKDALEEAHKGTIKSCKSIDEMFDDAKKW